MIIMQRAEEDEYQLNTQASALNEAQEPTRPLKMEQTNVDSVQGTLSFEMPVAGNQPGNKQASMDAKQQVQLSNLVGEYGAYQLAITALLFIRYAFLGLMANSGPLMTPDVTFYCSLPMAEVLSIMPNISTLSVREQELEIREEFKQICQIDLHLYRNQTQLEALNSSRSFKTSPIGKIGNLNLNFTTISSMPANTMPRTRECVDFTYDLAPDQGTTMTNEFDLVCDRDWLRSLFQSLLSASIVVAHVFWGTFSDKYGRFQAQRICLAVSLIAGILSIFAMDFWTFTLARALCSFGDLGLVVSQTTTVVELVGQRYRGISVALVNFGFAFGVSLLPYIVAYFENFRMVIGFTVLCNLLTVPFILATNESPRWLLTNRRFLAARKELKRIVRFNKLCENSWISAKSMLGLRTNEDETAQKSAEKSYRAKRQHFEIIFKELALQIDRQNLFDPVTKDMVDLPIPDQGQAGLSKSQPEIVIFKQPKHLEDRDLQNQDSPRAFDNLPDKPGTSMGEHTIQSASQTVIETCQPTGSNGNESTLASQQDLEPSQVGNDSNIRRAISCEQLGNDVMRSHDPEAQKFDAEKRKRLDARTLTLPLASRASSIYDYDDEYDEGPIRRRQPNAHHQHDCITSCNMVAQQLSFVGRVSRLFKDKKLMVAVFTIVWTTFNSELLYTSFIIINLEVGEDIYLNYMLGGCMEALAAISASLLLSYSPRRVSLIAFWLLISLSCFGLSLAHIDSTWAVWALALAKFSQSSLSSIASVAAYESFPTFLRQSGSGLVFTLGMMGSVFAPLIFAEFDDHAGMDRVLMTFSCSALIAAILIQLFLRETRGCELT